MPTDPSEFVEITDLPGAYTATKGNLRCTAVTLADGRLCLYSPVAGIGPKADNSLSEIGDVAFLLAPNQYHNKGLAEYTALFPEATLIAPSACHARLTKITSLTFQNLAPLQAALPADIKVITPQGLKTGEVWLGTDKTIIVTDAFAGPDKPGGEATLLKTFPRYGVGDGATYRAWVTDFMTTHAPTTLVPCHGHIVSDPKLAEKLTALATELG